LTPGKKGFNSSNANEFIAARTENWLQISGKKLNKLSKKYDVKMSPSNTKTVTMTMW
jgi:hypothetical protein